MPRVNLIGQTSNGCQRGCRKCVPANLRCADNKWQCPSQPVIKIFHQGIVMSGDGKPPGSEGGVDHDNTPDCFLYQHWYDCSEDKFYRLNRNLRGKVENYLAFDNGAQFLNNFRLTAPNNLGSLGAVLTSENILSLQNCINQQVAQRGNSNVPLGNSQLTAQARLLNCAINQANKGSLGFIYGNPPVPAVLNAFSAGAGYTLTPDYWIVPGALPDGTLANGFQDFGWTVFVRDPRNNRYYRDSYNDQKNDPGFPDDPCDGELLMDDPHQLIYEFDARKDFCRWYLLDASPAVNGVLNASTCPINEGLDTLIGTCEIDEDFGAHCRCKCDAGDCD